MKYEIEIKEIKAANYSIEAASKKEAKEIAYWRLLTQTHPPIKTEIIYEVDTNEVL